MTTLKELSKIALANKAAIGHRALVLGGSLAGLVVVEGLLSKDKVEEYTETVSVVEYEEGEVTKETTVVETSTKKG